MQGVRRSEVALGETACVIGLGLIGQLVVRLLVASGSRSWGWTWWRLRCRAAEKAGALRCAKPDDEGVREVEQVLLERSGLGADHVLLAAGGDSNGPVEVAARLARTGPGWWTSARRGSTCRGTPTTTRSWTSGSPGRTGRVGTTRGTSWRASTTRPGTSGGPSDATSFLDLVAAGSVDVTTLIDGIHPIEEAEEVYGSWATGR